MIRTLLTFLTPLLFTGTLFAQHKDSASTLTPAQERAIFDSLLPLQAKTAKTAGHYFPFKTHDGHDTIAAATITGQVTGEKGEPVPSATVAFSTGNITVTSAQTDSAGYYTITPLRPGSYDVTITSPAFEMSVSKGVGVNSGVLNTFYQQLSIDTSFIPPKQAFLLKK